jgi:HlyD family secretion protein
MTDAMTDAMTEAMKIDATKTRRSGILRGWGLLPFAVLLAGCGAPEVDLAGTVERRVVELAAPASEVIVELPVAEGERVAAGQVVVQLDTAVWEAELNAHQAGLAAARALLTEAEGEFTRQERLRKSRVATQQALDAARRQRDEAVAQVAEKQARIAQAQKRLENLTLRAFAPGVVDQLPFEVGERVPAGGVVAVVVADEAPWVRVFMPARAVARVGVGSPAEVRVAGLDEPLAGTVRYLAREPEFTPHYALTERESAHLVYESRVELDDAPEGLRAGLPAWVRLELAR